MPGVPSGRGCDNCRKSKKKCDQAKPACTRCARRGIECVGAGEKRWKFMEEGPNIVAKKRSSNSSSGSSSGSRTPPTDQQDMVRLIPKNPQNNATLLGQALVASYKGQTDLKYNLVWAYGGYLAMIPRHLGVNEALDAAVDSLVTAHRSFASRGEVTITALSKYSKALGALRTCLNNPSTARSTETLCAVMVLMSTQHIVGPAELKWTGHAEGAAKILKARKNCAPRDTFERILLLSLRGPVLFEGLFNPNIELTPQEWKELVVSELDATNPEGIMLRNLSLVPDILHRVKTNTDGLAGLLILQAELKSLYVGAQEVANSLRDMTTEIENSTAEEIPNPYGFTRRMFHAHTQRFQGIALTICLYMNYVLVLMKTIDPILAEDATRMAFEMMTIAENANTYRPFGAAYVTLGLAAAWVCVDDFSVRLLIETWLEDYMRDFNVQSLDGLGLLQSFRELDPFAGGSPMVWSENEEQAIYNYDPLLDGPPIDGLVITTPESSELEEMALNDFDALLDGIASDGLVITPESTEAL
ncbi:hypothetical protein BJY04DRAFT_199981 [Aspergillus karnatakaensis]|uniref:Zn(II)2Cys6 transcription factor n=1 Tax=Aspergillus karnatakaensis TaxID=1810916 RepID=UPI003CCCA4E2